MAKKNKNTQAQNQYYAYDPMYGYVPVDAQGNVINNPQTDTTYNEAPQGYPNNFGQPYGQGYGQGYGRGQGYGQGFGFHPHFNNPMQQNHMMQMSAMQEQINQLQTALNGGTQAGSKAVSQEKIQEIYSVMNDISQGKAGPEQLLPLMQNTSADFWKGLALGAGAILLFNCTPLKEMLTNILGAGLGSFMGGKEESEFDDDGFDPEPSDSKAQ